MADDLAAELKQALLVEGLARAEAERSTLAAEARAALAGNALARLEVSEGELAATAERARALEQRALTAEWRGAELTDQVAELAQDVSTLRELVAEQERALEGVVGSLSWKASKPLRATMAVIRPTRGE